MICGEVENCVDGCAAQQTARGPADPQLAAMWRLLLAFGESSNRRSLCRGVKRRQVRKAELVAISLSQVRSIRPVVGLHFGWNDAQERRLGKDPRAGRKYISLKGPVSAVHFRAITSNPSESNKRLAAELVGLTRANHAFGFGSSGVW